jgi:hypothetical protein
MATSHVSEFFQFSWPVEVFGYSWVKARPINPQSGTAGKFAQYLCVNPPSGGRRVRTLYNPLITDSGLFKTFAMWDPGPAAIAEFANRYGQLGAADPVTLDGQSTVRRGETLPVWALEIMRMRRAVDLWDAIGNMDVRKLERQIKWEKNGVFYYSHSKKVKQKPPGYTAIRIATKGETPEILARFVPGDVLEPAKFALQRIVNKALKGAVSPQLLFDDGELGFFEAPDSLRSAMWLQFAQAVGGHKKIIKCERCDTWFQVAPGVGRYGKKYCTDACRAAAHRKKRAKK